MVELTLPINYQNHQLELQNLWFIARSSGDYDKARWLRDQLKPHKDDISTLAGVRRSLLKSIEYWEKSYKRGTVAENMRLEQAEAQLKQKEKKKCAESVANLVRVAPAAIEIGTDSAAVVPRLGNTGGTYTSGEITPLISTYHVVDKTLKLRKRDAISKVDWISASFPYVDGEEEQRLLWAAITDLMDRAGISIAVRGKGHHGYTDSAELCISQGEGASRHVGFLAWSEKQGYFMEVSGFGCDFLMKHVDDLYTTLVVHAGRITRLDIALDLHSEYCLDKGLTVPKFSKQVAEGGFRSVFMPNHVKQRCRREGDDWEDFIHGDMTVESYDPLTDAPRGLSVYAGGDKSDNQIVFYEKGKQLLGAIPDKEAEEFRYLLACPELSEEGKERFTHLCDKHEIDQEKCRDRAWIRVERRLKRGSNKKFISPEMLLDPDSAFCHTFEGLEALFQDYSQHVKESYTDVQTFRRVSTERLEVMSLTKKLHYARQSVGSLVHTLQDMDYSAEQIVEKLASDYPLKDIIFDLLE